MADLEKQTSAAPGAAPLRTDSDPTIGDRHGDGKQDPEKVITKDGNVVVLEDIGDLKEIKTKTMGWVHAAGLMFGEYVVIAILSFPSSYAVLGMAGGVLTTIIIGLVTLYTSHVLWQYCMKYPHLKDIVEVTSHLFNDSRIAYEVALVGFLLNNLFIMGLHTLAGSVALNTISEHATCTLVFSAVITLAMFCLSLFRELKAVAFMGMFAAATMFLALFLTWIFAGIEDSPEGYNGGPITVTAFATKGTTFVAGFNAVLNITYTYIGQVLVPTYVHDMSHPEDFPKALFACTIAEIVLFTLGGSILYHYVGNEYVTSPVYGSLRSKFAKAVAGFTLPTILIVGVLYSAVTSRVIYNRIFSDERSVHRRAHTSKGWIVWVSIVATGWVIAWIIGEAVPFFNSLLSLMSSLFDSWFGFLLLAIAWWRLNRGSTFNGPLKSAEAVLNIVVAITGAFIFCAGTYTSVQSIIDGYENGETQGAFTCANNAPTAE